jgi:large subunit ribosomal protein L18e
LQKSKKTNETLITLITELKKKAYENKAPIYKDLACRLEKPARNWAEVNISRLAAHTKKGDIVVIPGKLLGSGELKVPITVAAFSFSESAKKKIKNAGGRSISIAELAEKRPHGKGIRIIG